MAARPVDFRGALIADVPRGRIETRDQRRLVALPAEWLDELLVSASPSARDAFATALSGALEPDARAALDGAPGDAAVEDIAWALSCALAARGMGVVEFERWGDAMTLVWRDPPGEGDAWGELAASTAAGLLARLTGLDVAGAPLGRDASGLRVLLGSVEACTMARERVHAGDGLGAIVARLERAEGAGR